MSTRVYINVTTSLGAHKCNMNTIFITLMTANFYIFMGMPQTFDTDKTKVAASIRLGLGLQYTTRG